MALKAILVSGCPPIDGYSPSSSGLIFVPIIVKIFIDRGVRQSQSAAGLGLIEKLL